MRILLRNWHLKLGAVVLATILYTGLVFSGSFSEEDIQLPIQTTGQPGNVFVLTGDPGTVAVRYRVANDEAARVGADSFVATVDLSEYDMDRAPAPQVVPVEVQPLFDGITVVRLEPATVTVALDRLEARDVEVRVDHGTVPDGLETEPPQIDVDVVSARGPASMLARIDHALARVRVDPSGIDVERDVLLEPVDIDGQPVPDVELTPEVVRVQIPVRAVETNKTVPVRPDITGTPAPGFELTALTVEPQTVTLRGQPAALAEVVEVTTEPISIDGLDEGLTVEAALVLPDGSRLADGSVQPIATLVASVAPSVSSRTFVVGTTCQGNGQNACLPNLEQVSVTLAGPGGVLAGLTATDLTVLLDVTGLGAGQHTITAGIAGVPNGMELVGISPAAVPVTITAPATPAPTPAP